MLRLLVLALALANVGYFLWSQGALAVLGWAPVNQSEPYRLDQQIRPDAIRLLPGTPSAPASVASGTAPSPVLADTATATAPAASSPSPLPVTSAASIASAAFAAATAGAAPSECLQAGVFTDVQANALRTRLQASLPDGRWALNPVVEPARWIIYMGRYADEETVVKKRGELRARGVSFEAVQNPGLNPGLSLGHFETKLDADRELAKDAERGVRTARVIQERAERRGHRLELPNVDALLKTRLAAFKPLLAGKALTSCR